METQRPRLCNPEQAVAGVDDTVDVNTSRIGRFVTLPEARMNSSEITTSGNDRRPTAMSAPNVASLPHGSTQDQVNEMESEGQATKQGQKPNPSATSPGRRELEVIAMDMTRRQTDNDSHKGAKEDDRPGPERSSHPGLGANGLPNDPIAIAQDALGAAVDGSQG
jgi:hypothetical protein